MTEARRVLDRHSSEQAWMRQVIDAARLLGWHVYHTFDSRHSTPGFPDLVLVRDRVIFAELKVATGKVSHHQRRWLELLRRAGQETYVWRPSDYPAVEQVLRRPT